MWEHLPVKKWKKGGSVHIPSKKKNNLAFCLVFFSSTFLRTDTGKRRYTAWPSQEVRCLAVIRVCLQLWNIFHSLLSPGVGQAISWKIGFIIKLLFVSPIVSVILAGLSRKADTTFSAPYSSWFLCLMQLVNEAFPKGGILEANLHICWTSKTGSQVYN